ncbi:MAG: trypsin-like peptidase domain-containing protein [Pseudomonadota bacterium]
MAFRTSHLLALVACVLAGPSQAQNATTGLRAMEAENDALVWQAVGRLDAKRSGFCTATLIAPDLVLTAAHCVYDPQSGEPLAPEELTFKAGLRQGRIAASRAVAQIEAHPSYDPQSPITAAKIRHDVALLRLARPIPTSELDPFVVQEQRLSTGPVSVVSYGRNRENLPSRQDICKVKAMQEGVIFMDCNVTFGSSGAPVFSHQNGRGQIVSIISGMAQVDGRKMALGMALPKVVHELRHRMWANKERPVAEIKRITVGGGNRAGGARFLRP